MSKKNTQLPEPMLVIFGECIRSSHFSIISTFEEYVRWAAIHPDGYVEMYPGDAGFYVRTWTNPANMEPLAMEDERGLTLHNVQSEEEAWEGAFWNLRRNVNLYDGLMIETLGGLIGPGQLVQTYTEELAQAIAQGWNDEALGAIETFAVLDPWLRKLQEAKRQAAVTS